MIRRRAARMGATNNVTIATTSKAAASNAFGAQTYQIRVAAPAACFARLGDPAATPTATASDALIVPNKVQFLIVTPGPKISVFSTTTQTVSIVEVAQ